LFPPFTDSLIQRRLPFSSAVLLFLFREFFFSGAGAAVSEGPPLRAPLGWGEPAFCPIFFLFLWGPRFLVMSYPPMFGPRCFRLGGRFLPKVIFKRVFFPFSPFLPESGPTGRIFFQRGLALLADHEVPFPPPNARCFFFPFLVDAGEGPPLSLFCLDGHFPSPPIRRRASPFFLDLVVKAPLVETFFGRFLVLSPDNTFLSFFFSCFRGLLGGGVFFPLWMVLSPLPLFLGTCGPFFSPRGGGGLVDLLRPLRFSPCFFPFPTQATGIQISFSFVQTRPPFHLPKKRPSSPFSPPEVRHI